MTKIIVMGVVNITPNSFSDGGQHLIHHNVSNFIRTHSSPENIFDFGAESTAPFNSKVSYQDEISRLQDIITNCRDCLKSLDSISIDTYKVEVMERVLEVFKEEGLSFSRIIWNDVSGILDSSTLDFLKAHEEVDYVLSHNLVTNKENTQKHMEYTLTDFSVNLLEEYFASKLKILEKNGILLTRIILDPCFGFSKTLEQNLTLLDSIHLIQGIHPRWLLGISKKSFLQSFSDKETKEERMQESEKVHLEYLCKWIDLYKCEELLLRVHAPDLLKGTSTLNKK